MKDLDQLPTELKVEGAPDSPDGRYVLPHPKIKNYFFHVIFSSGMDWEHMSVSLIEAVGRKHKGVTRCCTWAEMCVLKSTFWRPEEVCIQYHPAMADYINNHAFVLHVWRPTKVALPVPDAVMVGLSDQRMAEVLTWITEQYPGRSKEKYYEAIYYSDITKFGTPEFEEVIKTFFQTL